MEQVLFKESQPMTGGWILSIVIVVLLFIMVPRFRRVDLLQKIVGICTLAILIITATIMLTLRLETVYYPHRAEYRFASFFGLGYDAVSLDSVTTVKIITYSPSGYGGWGVKGNDSTKAYNASGNKGIIFTFRSGYKLLLGTQQPDSLQARLKGYYPL